MTTARLSSARQAKQDEFYTSLHDIELELEHYKKHFKNKIVYCNCDDPRASNFYNYFAENFERLGLKKLLTTCYRSQDCRQFSRGASDQAVFLELSGERAEDNGSNRDAAIARPLQGDGDFRSAECIRFLKQADIVVTNPPFSLFREYVGQLIEHKKKFLIIGNMNALTYKEVFPLFQHNQMWYGPSIRSGDREFQVPADYPLNAASTRVDREGNRFVRVKGVRWFTNLDYHLRHKDLELQMTYKPENYPKYANYDAIDVSKTMNIPKDYSGLMGVPISFLDKHNPDQFEICGSSKTLSLPMSQIAEKGTYQQGGPRFYLPNGDGTFRRMYDRIVIRNRRLK
ncbi:hypothetical protein PH7735_00358 [Shimia thalassica]|uniref:Modification methylase n=1 Tax=Shimia thalassica TaxID=1715693 RepID=A0A0P1I1B7_9RHOB|nr:adenine-specific methyltransferase EcoRI family protein [Shimia thalassica]CUJ84270.1 hypothetical protein PH7735_00358 [Shimia thalassica]